jgi:hypothetical protein
LKLLFTNKSNTYYMQVMCIKGHEGLLTEGATYTVTALTPNGNYLLEEVEVPEGYTSFSHDRFAVLSEAEDGWTLELEEAYWAQQPTPEYSA